MIRVLIHANQRGGIEGLQISASNCCMERVIHVLTVNITSYPAFPHLGISLGISNLPRPQAAHRHIIYSTESQGRT